MGFLFIQEMISLVFNSGMFVAIVDVPALPGATKIFFTFGDCFSFHTKACSLPPPPIIKIFIVYNVGSYTNGVIIKSNNLVYLLWTAWLIVLCPFPINWSDITDFSGFFIKFDNSILYSPPLINF